MAKPLTAAAVEKYRPGAKRRRIPDGGARSLFLIIEPSGHKAWQMRFRRLDGKPGKMTLGDVKTGKETPGAPVIGMPLTLEGARQLAADIHRQRALGLDPIKDHKARRHRERAELEERQAGTFPACVHRYIQEYSKRKNRDWRDAARQLGLDFPRGGGEAKEIKGGLVQLWSKKPVRKIDHHDIWSVTDEAKRVAVPGLKARNLGLSEARARRLLVALGGFFTWAREHRLVDTNPCRDVPRPAAPEARDRVLDDDEVRWFWQACDAADAPLRPGAPKPFAPLLKLLLLTGQRLDEVAGMTRDELNDGTWSLPGSRTKNKKPHVVPLSPLALDLIASMTGHKNQSQNESGFLFTTTGTSAVSGWSRMKHRLDAAMLTIARKERGAHFTIKPWRLHDLRRTAVTGMVKLSVLPHVVELVVNHISGHRAGVAGTYNKAELLPERREALKRWAAHIAGLTAPPSDKIVKLPRRRGATGG
jgi:integrase